MRRQEGRRGRRDAEEGGRGGRRDEESEKMKKLFKKMKNEKVAKGRIIGFAGPCFLIVSPFFGAPGPTQEPGPHSAAKRHPKTLFPISHPTTRPPRSLSPSNSHCGKTPSQGTKFIQILYGIRDKHVCPCLTFNTPFFISFQNFDLQLHTRFAHVFRAAFSIFGVTLP